MGDGQGVVNSINIGVMRYLFLFLVIFSLNAAAQDNQIRVIMIGAHPDDCDQEAGGTAIMLSKLGYAVKFVAVTNGDAGHQSKGGGMLAKRRYLEAQEAGKRFGVTYDVLDNHDGELVAVPNVAAETPPLKKNPVFLYFQDFFQRPNPFRPDIAIDISSVFDQKVHALDAHQSQFYEWLPWIGGYADQVPKNIADREKWLATNRAVAITPDVRTSLEKWYGKEKATAVKHAEAFEVCEYGKQPKEDELRKLFPMLRK